MGSDFLIGLAPPRKRKHKSARLTPEEKDKYVPDLDGLGKAKSQVVMRSHGRKLEILSRSSLERLPVVNCELTHGQGKMGGNDILGFSSSRSSSRRRNMCLCVAWCF
jgi:hypothetical protein